MFGLKQSVPVVLITSMCLSGCGGQSNQPSDPSAAASQRLQGDWRLLSFAPSIALEPLLQGLLDAQLQALNINFANGQFTAVGPGVDTSGRYEITNAAGDSLSGRVYDRAGAGYGISGTFVASQFRFTSTDSPWAGNGVLDRAR